MIDEELLKVSILMNDTVLFEKLIKTNKVDLNWQDADGRCALHWAVISEHGLDYAKILLAHDADLQIKDKQGHTSAELAAILGRKHIAEFLKEFQVSRTSTPKKQQAKKYSVCIIGGGIAGISAAHQLVQQGFHVTILEARSRLGGRIETVYLDNQQPIELGCHFIHGPVENPLTPLLKKFNLDYKPIDNSKIVFYASDGKVIDPSSDSSSLAQLVNDTLLTKVRVSALSQNMAVEQKNVLRMLSGIIHKESVLAPDKRESLLSYKLGLTQDYAGGNYLIVNGYDKLLQGLIAEVQSSGLLDIKLHHIVHRVIEKKGKLQIISNQGEHEADVVICTVPLGVLKQNGIVFKPALPDKKIESIEKLGVAIHEKTILQFEKDFWPADAHYLAPYDSETKIWREIINLHHFQHGQSATLCISNHANIEELDKPDQTLIDSALKLLKNVFGNKISPLKYSKVTRWHRDPYSYGSYSYHTKDSNLTDNNIISEPCGRIFFAGEHTSYFPSSLDGAYLSGINVAKEITNL